MTKRMGWKVVTLGAVATLTLACGQLTTQEQEEQKQGDTGVTKKQDDAGTPSVCPSTVGTIVTYPADQIIQHLNGRWQYCSGDYPIGAGDGLEFDAAHGLWYVLVKDGAGSLVRKTGFKAGGPISQDDVQPTQTNLLFTEGGGYIGFVTFTASPEVMQYDPGLESPPVYAPLP